MWKKSHPNWSLQIVGLQFYGPYPPANDFLYCLITESIWSGLQMSKKGQIKFFNHWIRLFLQKTIIRFFHIVSNSDDFHVYECSIRKAHQPNWHLLLCFCLEHTAQYFSEPRSSWSECYKALIILGQLVRTFVFRRTSLF